MTEINQVLVGIGKPESPKHSAVDAVKKTLTQWWERVGPARVEKKFIEAHARVRDSFTSEERKNLHDKQLPKWQAAGKRWGIAATVIDFGIVALGATVSTTGLRDPMTRERMFSRGVIDKLRATRFTDPLARAYDSIFTVFGDHTQEAAQKIADARAKRVGQILSVFPALGSLATLINSGLGHGIGFAAAGVKEQAAAAHAKIANYTDSGAAKVHAEKIGNAARDGLKYVVEHPDEIRRTVETIQQQKQKADIHKQTMQESREAAAKAALEREFAEWKADEIAHNKAYYDLSGTEPTRDTFLEWKKNRDASKKAAAKAEGRKI